MNTSRKRVQSRQIKIATTVNPDRSPAHDYPCVVIWLRPRKHSRVIETPEGTIKLAMTGAEVRLLAAHFREIYPRIRFRFPGKVRHKNRHHIPGRDGWQFKQTFPPQQLERDRNRDRSVVMGYEYSGHKLARKWGFVVELKPRPYSRVRVHKWSISWMPNSDDFRHIAGRFGQQIDTSTPGELENKMQMLSRTRRDLKGIFDKIEAGEIQPNAK